VLLPVIAAIVYLAVWPGGALHWLGWSLAGLYIVIDLLSPRIVQRSKESD
jgi:hypothetical protein